MDRPAIRLTLIVVLGAIALIALGYFAALSADHAARQEWEATLADLKARGEPTDITSLIPPPVPDAGNLAAIDLFKMERNANGDWQSIRLDAALNASKDLDFMPAGSFHRAERPDWNAVAAMVAKAYQTAFPGKSRPALPFAQLEQLLPVLTELRIESSNRPQCRFNVDYTSQPPFNRHLGPLSASIRLAKVEELDALLALHGGNSAVALDDIKISLKLARAMDPMPNLIGPLVGMALTDLTLSPVQEGLVSHVWSDAQLQELQKELTQFDDVAGYVRQMRGHALGESAPDFEYIRDHRALLATYAPYRDNPLWVDRLMPALLTWGPDAPFDLARSDVVKMETLAARLGADPAQHRIYPRQVERLGRQISGISDYSPTAYLVRDSEKIVIGSADQFAQAQFKTDAARIACMVERYRLAHGRLPDLLGELAAYGPVPNDLFTGQSYHYHPRTDGTFLLYSVGWNLSDEDGKAEYVVKWSGAKPSPDPKNGDWLWPQPGHPGS